MSPAQSPSSSGLGLRPFKAATRVRIPLGALPTSADVATLAAHHDLKLAYVYCDRVDILDAGDLVASGTPEGVLSPELIADVFGVRAARLTHPMSGRLHLAFGPLVARSKAGG